MKIQVTIIWLLDQQLYALDAVFGSAVFRCHSNLTQFADKTPFCHSNTRPSGIQIPTVNSLVWWVREQNRMTFHFLCCLDIKSQPEETQLEFVLVHFRSRPV